MNSDLASLSEAFKKILTGYQESLDITNYLNNFNSSTKDIIEEYLIDAKICPLKLDTKETTKNKVIGYMGVEGAFAYEALKTLYPKATYTNYNTFKDVFEALKNDKITCGVLPIENSQTGSINDNYDLIREYNCYIIKELSLKVSQNLLGIKGTKLSDIRLVYSHPQAILQSKNFLDRHNLKYEFYTNTATSAKLVKELNDRSIASISSKACAELYNLDVIASDINENQTNTTRFVVVSKNLEISPEATQISIIFNLKHESGTLYQVLKDIKDYNLNVTRIESRPIKNKPFEYFFYLDFIGNINDLNVIRALTKIKKDAINMRLLGNY